MNNIAEVQIQCPYCGEEIAVQVEFMDSAADYVEDCTVCCRPIQLHVALDENGQPSVAATREQE